tara:strand:+ start:779 stop:1459 length:681 start_codon:yes stop_codon:yes gene_type:complete
MSNNVDVILLEKVDKLGAIGEVVSVKPGYARNYLLPQSKALRATQDNIAYFEQQKAAIEKVNEDKRKEAEKKSTKIKDATIVLIRQASETGQLYGSITARDISDAVNELAGEKIIRRADVRLNENFKTVGLFTVEVAPHPEVILTVTLNIARSGDEAQVQAETGKALIANDEGINEPVATVEVQEEEFLEESALKAKEAAEDAEAQAEQESEASTEDAAEEEQKAS